jgi:TolA-binding protein
MYFSRAKYFLLLSLLFVFSADEILAGEFKEKLGLGFNVNSQKLYGDARTGKFVFGVNPALIRYNFNSHVYLDADIGLAQLSSNMGVATLKTNMINLGFKVGYRLLQQYKINPLLYLGGGIFNFQLGSWSRFWDAYGSVGGGVEFFLSNNLGLNLTGDLRYTTGDDFDGGSSGKRKDAILNLGFGFIFYLGGRGEFISEPEFTTISPEEPPTYEEVTENNESPAETVEQNGSTPDMASEDFSEEREKLLKTKLDLEQTLELMRLKLRISQNQVQRLEQKLLILSNPNKSVSQSFENSEIESFIVGYRTALAYFEAGNYPDAIRAFKNLIDENPKGALTNLGLFWLGESYFANQDYNSAVEAYQKVLENTNSLKKELALLMLGLSRWKKCDISAAKADLKRLVESYPQSETVPLAKQYLAKISS